MNLKGVVMQMKTKNALVVLLFILIGFGVVVTFDYTDDYVGDRFNKAFTSGQYVKGEAFSLDAFLEYYDWDRVCVALPYSTHEFRNRLGLSYAHSVTEDSGWSLVFIRGDYVVAEIPFEKSFLEHPLDLEMPCFDRWSAIVIIDDNDDAVGSNLRLSFAGN
jgi:hypothetical protein